MMTILSAICASCASTGASGVDGLPSSRQAVSSALYDFDSGKIKDRGFVSVSGYLTFGDDKHNLWESSRAYEYIKEKMPPLGDRAWKECISLSFYGNFRRSLKKYDGKEVIISGYIYRHTPARDEVNLGSCNEIFISMEGPGARVAPVRE
jgi:hypothetical protein